MKVFLIILTMFATLGLNTAHAADGPEDRREKASGVLTAIGEFFASLFGKSDDDDDGSSSSGGSSASSGGSSASSGGSSASSGGSSASSGGSSASSGGSSASSGGSSASSGGSSASSGGSSASSGGSSASSGGSAAPPIQNNDSSVEFIAAQIAAETGWAKEKMIPYSTRLAKTLSQLSAKEQAEVFYGSN